MIKPFLQLIRLDKPAGILLLLWPTLTALWIASAGKPQLSIVLIFVFGTVLTRSAGCILNDLADRKFDGAVARTQQRPLITGAVSVKHALFFCAFLLLLALGLVLCLNTLSLLLAGVAVLLTAAYPFAKRFTYFPQFVLGMTFNLGILMAFAAQTNSLPGIAWLLYIIALLWTVIYDTQYGMSDRIDDLKIGVKSFAILLGDHDRAIIAGLQIAVLGLLIYLGRWLHHNNLYYACLVITAILFIYHQFLIVNRDPKKCIAAFINNHWAWFSVFCGTMLNYF